MRACSNFSKNAIYYYLKQMQSLIVRRTWNQGFMKDPSTMEFQREQPICKLSIYVTKKQTVTRHHRHELDIKPLFGQHKPCQEKATRATITLLRDAMHFFENLAFQQDNSSHFSSCISKCGILPRRQQRPIQRTVQKKEDDIDHTAEGHF